MSKERETKIQGDTVVDAGVLLVMADCKLNSAIETLKVETCEEPVVPKDIAEQPGLAKVRAMCFEARTILTRPCQDPEPDRCAACLATAGRGLDHAELLCRRGLVCQ